MFKSVVCRIIIVIILTVWNISSGYSAVNYDTLATADNDVDSTLLYLKSKDFNRILDQAILYQNRADSLHRLSIEMRKEASRMDDPVSRGQFQKKIIRIEDSVLVLRSIANKQFMILSEGMPGSPGTIHPFLVKDTVISGITVYNYNLSDEFMARLDEIRQSPETESDDHGTLASKILVAENSASSPKKETSGSSSSKTASTKSSPSIPSGNYAGLIISDASPYGQGKSFERDYSIPPGVFYRIQLAVYRKALPADHFGGLAPITTENIPERDLIRYFAGKFSHMEDAKTALVKVRALGYPDAFMIGYYDGVKVSFSKLKGLEK